jgi:hypothetical protein
MPKQKDSYNKCSFFVLVEEEDSYQLQKLLTDFNYIVLKVMQQNTQAQAYELI